MINHILKRMFKNASMVFGGSAIAAVMGLICISMTARTLGAKALGVFAMIQSFVIIVDSLTNFKCWQAVIKFGADFTKQNEKEKFAALTKFCTILDITTAAVGTVIAITAVYFFGIYKGLHSQTMWAAAGFSLWILFNLKGTAVGLLRLNDKFKYIALANVVAMIVKLILVTIAYFLSGGLIFFVCIWAVSGLVESVLLLCGGWKEANAIYGRSFFKSKLRTVTADKKIWKFVICTNLNQSIRFASREMDVLIVGAVLGAAATGIYKVARQFALAMAQLTEPVYQAIYPELARLATERKFVEMKKVMIKASIGLGSIALAVWLGFVVFGRWFLTVAAGAEYASAYSVMIVFMAALVIWAFTFSLPAGLLAIGRADKNVLVQLVCLVVFLPALYFLLILIGLIGASIGQVLFFVCYAAGSLFFFAKNISKEKI